MATGEVVAIAPFQRLELPGNQCCAARWHEIEVAGVARGDHGHTQRHRFGKSEPESFGAVQADEGVGFVVERIELLIAQQGLDPADARIARCQGIHGHGLFRKLFGAAGFDQQLNRGLILRMSGKGLLEGADHRFRVFALRSAPEIEEREKGEREAVLALAALLLTQSAAFVQVRPVRKMG